ncbi:inverse autotransporter beta domain-containing protein [Acerihabitans sp. KWT182]|uniref:Inverse autotransporter beta domain-containing protein n=1 Tax=Acerihabitans sp. KWT182 TaxID=3157919 RepID=A0AAU7QC45_9GAMM
MTGIIDDADPSANVPSYSQSARESPSQFGTARVQFDFDDDEDLHGTSIDLLAPLSDQSNTLLFAQLGGRRRDSRNTANLGAGARLFTHGWMLGVNSFIENDFTGTNRRISLGAELWTRYLKLSSNLYSRVNNWSSSPDFDDADDRPAFGYDMRGDAYLPFYPQLGARMVFEKYYGDGVALFDKNKQLESPRALIVGVNYTPIPLLTLALEQRVGSGDQSEDRITLQINYRLGLSWREQFNPQGVDSLRALDVSRYDVVERNGDMVLDYRR